MSMTENMNLRRILFALHRMFGSNLLMAVAGAVLLIQALTTLLLVHGQLLGLKGVAIPLGGQAAGDALGSRVRSLAAADKSLLVLTQKHRGSGVSGVWAARPEGPNAPQSWQRVSGPFDGQEILALAFTQSPRPTTAVATKDGGIYISQGDSSPWERLKPPPGLGPIRGLAFGPDTHLYAAGETSLARCAVFAPEHAWQAHPLPAGVRASQPELNLDALVKDIHTGRLLGPLAPFWGDFAGLCLLAFALTGLYRWFARRR